MIKWNLGSIIDAYGIKQADLAKKVDSNRASISNLKNKKTMPKIDGNRLNDLINAINNCLSEINNPTRITLCDLVQWIPDDE